jgi:hypothetical protein
MVDFWTFRLKTTSKQVLVSSFGVARKMEDRASSSSSSSSSNESDDDNEDTEDDNNAMPYEVEDDAEPLEEGRALPYDGDLQAAMKAGDRPAIKRILEHRAAERTKVAAAEASPLPAVAVAVARGEDGAAAAAVASLAQPPRAAGSVRFAVGYDEAAGAQARDHPSPRKSRSQSLTAFSG